MEMEGGRWASWMLDTRAVDGIVGREGRGWKGFVSQESVRACVSDDRRPSQHCFRNATSRMILDLKSMHNLHGTLGRLFLMLSMETLLCRDSTANIHR